ISREILACCGSLCVSLCNRVVNVVLCNRVVNKVCFFYICTVKVTIRREVHPHSIYINVHDTFRSFLLYIFRASRYPNPTLISTNTGFQVFETRFDRCGHRLARKPKLESPVLLSADWGGTSSLTMFLELPT
ncbi:hypothetical protein LINGRAHAP2_LOCUS11381, partial [Linum grandiflorum]